MIKRTIKQLTAMITVENTVSSFENVEFQGVCIDTRKLEKGNLFIPFKGEKLDGHTLVEKAIEQGAACALWEEDVPNPPMHLPIIIVKNSAAALQQLAKSYRNELDVKVVGITGSNGKTTTKDMTYAVLSKSYNVIKTEGNFNNELGLPLTILRMDESTEIAILEMGMSSFGEIEFLSNLAQPEVAVITNIGESHMQYLGSREGIAKAKLEILSGLHKDGLFVFNGEEPLLTAGVKETSLNKQSYGLSSDNDMYITNMEQQGTNSSFSINQSNLKFVIPVLGAHNVKNALAALLVGKFFNVSFEEMKEQLANLELTKMRAEMIPGPNGSMLINDAYNASPTSMKAAIDLISSLNNYEQKIVVLADVLELGELEVEYHQEIGKYVNPEQIDYVFTFGNLGAEIAKGALHKFSTEKVKAYDEKELLAKELKPLLDGKTVVLLKGSRGMRLEEVLQKL